MPEVAVVTDTTACIPPGQVARYDIEVVPIELIFEDRIYRDGIDISPPEFYERLRRATRLPTTAGSLPGPYFKAFQKCAERAKAILCITEPSRLSGMYHSAVMAREMMLDIRPELAIEIIACTSAAAGMGLAVLAAAREASRGKGLNEAAAAANNVMSRVELYASLDTLQYLVKGGRVPQAAGLVNSLLKIKPVFTINHADAHTVALPRTSKGALKYMLKMMARKVVPGKPLHVALMHADAPEWAETLRKHIAARYDCEELFITEFTPVMGAHTGPGLFGVAFYNEG